jgi:uncharacterized radical SAM superfamily Fe-S cluster-containing enzyme
MTRGVNEKEIGRILELALRKKNVRHVEVHTMTFTGQGGASFDRSGRISLYETLQEIERSTGGLLRVDDFVPSPHAHPLCYQIAYLLLDPAGGPPVPYTRFLDRQTFYECLSEHLYIEPSPRLEAAMQDAIARLWSEDAPDSARVLAALKRLLADLFPQGNRLGREAALRVAERSSKAVYVHSHMDEDTFDVERLAQCCDANCYPDGSTIPLCALNVLYKDKEAPFMARPATWNARTGGRKFPVVPS